MITFDPNDLLLGHTKVFLSPAEAQCAAAEVAGIYGMPEPVLVFEAANPPGVLAVCIQPTTSKHCTIQFDDRGCPIELLAHELAHAIEYAEGDEKGRHDDAFGILVCLVGWQLMDWLVSTWPYAPPVPLFARVRPW